MTDTTETMNATAENRAEEVARLDPSEIETVESDGAGREAARYRRALREAEAERDELRGQVETLRRTQAEKLAEAEGLRPAALWGAGTNLEDLTAPDGSIDPRAVTVAVKAARQTLGILPVPTVFAAGGQAIPSSVAQAFEQAFVPNHLKGNPHV